MYRQSFNVLVGMLPAAITQAQVAPFQSSGVLLAKRK
jgi:hypothetical protein